MSQVFVPAAITSGAFASKSESVAVIGENSDTYPLCNAVAAARRAQGKSVYELDGITEMANSRFDSPAVTSDLLIVRQLPQDGEHQVGMGTALSASKALGAVLFRRAEISKSTLIVSNERPLNWVTLNRLGPDTFWIAASLGIGLLLNPADLDYDKYLAGIKVPSNHRYRALFEQYSVAPMNCVSSPVILSEFDRDTYRPDWHWVNYWPTNH